MATAIVAASVHNAHYNVAEMRIFDSVMFVSPIMLFGTVAVIVMAMRRQVHDALYGNQEISPWDNRFVNGLLGKNGIWNLHKKFCKESSLRRWLLALTIAFLICSAVWVPLYAR